VLAAVDPAAPLRGVVHAAGFIADAVIDRQDWTTFQPQLSAKLAGAWHLHRLTREHELDFMLLYSSAAAVLGTIGQANYAAANSFLDALAAHRVALGRPAVSVGWGTWRDVGTVRDEIADLLGARGLTALSPLSGARWVAALLLGRLGQGPVAVMRFDPSRWTAAHPHGRSRSFLDVLTPPAPAPRTPAAPAVAPAPESGDTVDVVRGQIGRILRMPVERIGLDEHITRLGVDSLMAVELRSGLAKLGVSVPMVQILSDPTVAELARAVTRDAPAAGPDVGALSEAEVDDLIAESLGDPRGSRP